MKRVWYFFISNLVVISLMPGSEAQSREGIVQCRVELDCSGEMTVMTESQCCLSDTGMAFNYPGEERCYVCQVFGWVEETITKHEQVSSHDIQVVYQKGNMTDEDAYNFRVVSRFHGTTRPGMDFIIQTSSVKLTNQSRSQLVSIKLLVDGVAQEPVETFTLDLLPVEPSTIPEGTGVFFQQMLIVNIQDADTLNVFFTEVDYRAREPQQVIQIGLMKDKPIASSITMTVTPLTIDQAQNQNRLSSQIRDLLPPDNPISPHKADTNDFNSSPLSVVFEVDEGKQITYKEIVNLSITDDDVNEATEQYFVVTMDTARAENRSAIMIATESSLCVIVDNDPIRIGFEQPQYILNETIFEQDYTIYMAKEGNRASEQIFLVHFQDRALLNSSLPLATPGRSESDYFALDALQQMTSSMSRLPILVTVLRDDLTEGPEVFLLRSGSSTDSINTILFEKPINLYSETVVIIQDRGFDSLPLVTIEVPGSRTGGVTCPVESAGGNERVVCSSTLNCGTSIGMMSKKQCCVDRADGLAFTLDGSNACHPCIVFGWSTTSMFTTEDRFNPGRITAGFHKVGPTDSTRMTFTLNYFEVTAKEGPGLDFDGKPHNISFSTSQSTDVQLSVYVDSIALEPDEMFAIVLSPVSPLSITGEGVFFIDTTCITIRDGDTVNFFFAEEDYSALEGELMPISVTKSMIIASPITLHINMNVAMMDLTGNVLDTVERAGQDDFINNTLEVTFEADEMNHTKNRDVVQYIRITNDMISERPRQYFEVALSLPDGVQLQQNISLQRRNKSICVIIDRDNRVSIGFSSLVYTFNEQNTSNFYSVQLEIAGNQRTEESLRMAVVSSSCPVKYQEATASLDYLSLPSETTIVVLSAQARQHSLNNQLLPDTMPEGTEAFCLSVFRDVESPMFFQSIAQTSVVIVDDDKITIGFIKAKYSIREGDPALPVQVGVTEGILRSEVVLNVCLSQSNHSTEGRGNATLTSGSTVILNSSQSTATVQVLVQDDDIEEDTEMILLSLALVSSPSNIVVELGRATTEISVVDNDNLPDASNFPTVLVSIVVPVGFIVVLIAIIVLITVVAIVCKKRKRKSITQVVYEDPDDLEMSNVGKIVLADNTAYGSKENEDNITNIQPNAAYFVHKI